MNREQIENEIEQLLSNFSEQFTRAKNYKSIPQIELDLMKETIRNLYEHLYQLKNEIPVIEKNSTVAPVQPIEEKNVAVENIIHAIINEEKNSKTIPEVIVEELPEKEELIIQKQKEEIVQEKASIQRENIFIEQTKSQPKAVASLFDDVPTIADNYKEQQSLHHKIGNTKTERLSDKLQQEPVVDLKRSIGINEKFAFINELFGSNQQQYNEAIEALNNFSDYDEAHMYLDHLGADLHWNFSSNSYKELNELVKRRFGV